ncbi:MAG: energy transducer TonB [Bryobacteraceae bacterium]|nr:energy transducer TonB [Bryobacteraceae bacterium]
MAASLADLERVPELRLERALDWHDTDFAPNPKRAAAGSAVIHGILGLFFAWIASFPEPPRRNPAAEVDVRQAVKLVAPQLRDLTQTAPNKGEISKEVDLASLRAKSAPAARSAPMRAAAPPPSLIPRRLPPEAPAIEAPPQVAQNPLGLGTTPRAPEVPIAALPQIQTEERKPKLAFETPGSPGGMRNQGGANPKLLPPKPDITEAARAPARPATSAGIAVGDLEDLGTPGSLRSSPSATKPATGRVELMSDPLGVDFKPYLTRVLTMVRMNWLAVIPESARLGRQGRVVIQFIISRDGRVPKLVIATPSGTEALDRAAVTGVSASVPFPPLPAEFKGDQVRLQFSFAYNPPAR